MSGCAYFKFKSQLEYDTVFFDGVFVSVGDLKAAIVDKRHITDSDLVIANAQTGEEYVDMNFSIPKNTSVIVRRVPMVRPKVIAAGGASGGFGNGSTSTEAPDATPVRGQTSTAGRYITAAAMRPAPAKTYSASSNPFVLDKRVQAQEPTSDTGDKDEDSEIAKFISDSTATWEREKREAMFATKGGKGKGGGYQGKGGRISYGVPNPGYLCYRCGQPGHFIQECPTNGDPAYDGSKMYQKRQPTAGIPQSFLQVSEAGKLLTPQGETALFRSNSDAFSKAVGLLPTSTPVKEIPEHLKCSLCSGLYKDAVLIICCQKSFCSSCVRSRLMQDRCCPHCKDTKVIADQLYPNRDLRCAVEAFQRQQAEVANGVAALPSTGEAPEKAASGTPLLEAPGSQADAAPTASVTETPAETDVKAVLVADGEKAAPAPAAIPAPKPASPRMAELPAKADVQAVGLGSSHKPTVTADLDMLLKEEDDEFVLETPTEEAWKGKDEPKGPEDDEELVVGGVETSTGVHEDGGTEVQNNTEVAKPVSEAPNVPAETLSDRQPAATISADGEKTTAAGDADWMLTRTCAKCGKKGHISPLCPENKKKEPLPEIKKKKPEGEQPKPKGKGKGGWGGAKGGPASSYGGPGQGAQQYGDDWSSWGQGSSWYGPDGWGQGGWGAGGWEGWDSSWGGYDAWGQWKGYGHSSEWGSGKGADWGAGKGQSKPAGPPPGIPPPSAGGPPLSKEEFEARKRELADGPEGRRSRDEGSRDRYRDRERSHESRGYSRGREADDWDYDYGYERGRDHDRRGRDAYGRDKYQSRERDDGRGHGGRKRERSEERREARSGAGDEREWSEDDVRDHREQRERTERGSKRRRGEPGRESRSQRRSGDDGDSGASDATQPLELDQVEDDAKMDHDARTRGGAEREEADGDTRGIGRNEGKEEGSSRARQALKAEAADGSERAEERERDGKSKKRKKEKREKKEKRSRESARHSDDERGALGGGDSSGEDTGVAEEGGSRKAPARPSVFNRLGGHLQEDGTGRKKEIRLRAEPVLQPVEKKKKAEDRPTGSAGEPESSVGTDVSGRKAHSKHNSKPPKPVKNLVLQKALVNVGVATRRF